MFEIYNLNYRAAFIYILLSRNWAVGSREEHAHKFKHEVAKTANAGNPHLLGW
jgi:hypothetical protein